MRPLVAEPAPRPVRLAAAVAVVALLVVLVPVAARALVPVRVETASAGTREALPSSGRVLARVTPPVGWTLTALGGTLSDPVTYREGAASLSASATSGVASVEPLAGRQLRVIASVGAR